MNDATRRALRTVLQLIASGALTALVAAIVDGMDTKSTAIVLATWQVIVTFAQNALEDAGAIPALLKAPASSGENPVPDH